MADRFYRNGRQVTEDGKDLQTGGDPWKELHGVSWSSLETFIRSRKTYLRRHHLGTLTKPTTQPMKFGKVVHTAVLEPARFDDRVCVVEKVPRNTGAGKAAWEAFELGYRVERGPCDSKNRRAWKDWLEDQPPHTVAVLPKDYEDACAYLENLQAAGDRIQISDEEYEKCMAIKESVWGHPIARALLEKNGIRFESETHWIDQTGLEVFAHPDAIWPGGCFDLKTSNDIRGPSFSSSCERYGYFRQAAIYTLDAHREFFGDPGEAFYHIACDSSEPYDVEVYAMDDEWINDGAREVRAALNNLANCVKEDDWRSPGEKAGGAIELMRPPWAAGKQLAYELPG